MNLAHAHLVLNHIPLLTIPVVLIFLVYALWRGDLRLRRFSLLVLIATSASLIPVHLTGESAEKVVEHLPGISEQLIEAHEEAAEISLILTLFAGALAATALVFSDKQNLGLMLTKALVFVCLVSLATLAYTANLGGKIRHPEISDVVRQE